MAKRKKKAAKVPVVEDVLGEAGITGYGRKVAEREYTITPAERSEILQAANDHSGRLLARLDRIEQAAREVIGPHVSPLDETGNVPAGCKLTGLDLGGGKQAYAVPARPHEELSEAMQAIEHTNDICAWLARSCRGLPARKSLSAGATGRTDERVAA